METGPENCPRVIVFLNTDPRVEPLNYVRLDPGIMCATIVAYIAPYDLLRHNMQTKFFRGIPLVSWEEPGSEVSRAKQYMKLYEICGAEAAICLGWKYDIPGSSEAGIITVTPLLLNSLNGDAVSRLLHIRLHGKIAK